MSDDCHFFKLPRELRDEIYGYAFQPVISSNEISSKYVVTRRDVKANKIALPIGTPTTSVHTSIKYVPGSSN